MKSLQGIDLTGIYGGERTPFEVGREVGNFVGEKTIEIVEIAGWLWDTLSPFSSQ